MTISEYLSKINSKTTDVYGRTWIINGNYRYGLKPSRPASEIGPCEVCNKGNHGDMHSMATYSLEDGLACYHGIIFGHKECLLKKVKNF